MITRVVALLFFIKLTQSVYFECSDEFFADYELFGNCIAQNCGRFVIQLPEETLENIEELAMKIQEDIHPENLGVLLCPAGSVLWFYFLVPICHFFGHFLVTFWSLSCQFLVIFWPLSSHFLSISGHFMGTFWLLFGHFCSFFGHFLVTFWPHSGHFFK